MITGVPVELDCCADSSLKINPVNVLYGCDR